VHNCFIFIDGVKVFIEWFEDLEISVEVNNRVELIEGLSKVQADVILIDEKIPLPDGIEATKLVLDKYAELKFLVLTMNDRKEYS